jgi:hypothetical protein
VNKDIYKKHNFKINMKNIIKKILREEEEWLQSSINKYDDSDFPFEISKTPLEKPKKTNTFLIKTVWEYGDATLREEFVFRSDKTKEVETFVNVCRFYSKMIDSRGYDSWRELNEIAKKLGLFFDQYGQPYSYDDTKNMGDFVFGSDFPAYLSIVEILYYDKNGVVFPVTLK